MYKSIKALLRSILPMRFLTRNELVIRLIYYQFYRGGKYHCPICDRRLRKFIELENHDLLCPSCGSLARNRRLWDIIDGRFLSQPIKMLDFSPSRCIYRKLNKLPSINYVSSDFSGEFMASKHYDITKIDVRTETFDLIICYHILEHIEDDSKAMSELYRVLKKGGSAIIQTPFKEGEIYEDSSIFSPEDREKYFGQHDHVRVYSVEALRDRLTLAGFSVQVEVFTSEIDNVNGFSVTETILIAGK
jgi:SAM-dependent methyltransferase